MLVQGGIEELPAGELGWFLKQPDRRACSRPAGPIENRIGGMPPGLAVAPTAPKQAAVAPELRL
jgi:hypothetical protein